MPTEEEYEAAEERVDKRVKAYIKGRFDRDCFYCPMIEQFCRDLNEAHNEILRLQGVREKDFNRHDWPEWTPQANSIRWAEDLLKKKLAKTDLWTLYPERERPSPFACSSGQIEP